LGFTIYRNTLAISHHTPFNLFCHIIKYLTQNQAKYAQKHEHYNTINSYSCFFKETQRKRSQYPMQQLVVKQINDEHMLKLVVLIKTKI